MLLASADAVACALLGVFGAWHLWMVARNRTTLRPEGEEAYDLGLAANWRAVFGSKWELWAVPVWWYDAPEGDGMHFAVSDDVKHKGI
jgi:hypothetical protein